MNKVSTTPKEGKSAAKTTLRAVCAAFVIAALVIPILLTLLPPFLRPVYSDIYVGVLGEKFELLTSKEGPKCVVIGGSSVAFGLDSETLSDEIDMDVVNFGLYADLGTKVMLDLSLANIGEGDVIVVAPEISAQTLSLFFNAATTWQALDGNLEMLKYVDSDDYAALVGGAWKYAGDKYGYLISGEYPKTVDAFDVKNFNEYGDNTYDRPYNVMTTIEKTVDFNFFYDSGDGVTTEYEQFIDYLNDYARECRSRGAVVYYSFPPMNEAMIADTSEDTVLRYYNNLVSSLDMKVISNPYDYIMDEGYFFDSAFHLNNSGVPIRTYNLIEDIKRERADTSVTMADVTLPEPSGYKPQEFGGENGVNLHFNLELSVNLAGQSVYTIVGLNEAGMNAPVLNIPDMVDGVPVTSIAPDALSGAAARTLYLGQNISSLPARSLAGAMSLSAVYVPKKDSPDDIAIPNNSNPPLATEGASTALRFYVPADSVGAYKAHYFWGAYSERIKGY